MRDKDKTEAAASTAPLEAIMWPVIDLLAVMGISRSMRPEDLFYRQRLGISFLGVPVPWALIPSTLAGTSPASAMALDMLRTAPRPEVRDR